ncbi:MAG: 30S ribosomal protein S12 methylthiotransferase RimO [Selenomonadaceae bacterium]|nr:30S ribosomal protein S12 methylthiotransferase RimO [Selenomonadaceae bacterium]
MKVGMISLGCAKNLVDTETMLGILSEDGWELTADPATADVLIVNTCAFIESAKEESITTVIEMADYKDSGRCRALILAGCLAERYGKELLDELPEVDAIVGAGSWHRIKEGISAALRGNRVVITGDGKILYDAHSPRVRTTPQYTAYIKIAEGCNHACAFCAIPLIRGHYRSRKIEDIVEEAEKLANDGVREINLIAQDTTYYGTDIYGKASLAQLLKELVKIDKVSWIRVLYSYPKNFTDELIEMFKTEPKILKYVDLPLQHADNDILKKMGRPDTKESVETLLSKIRREIPDVTIRTTFLVGFPGETEAAFENLVDFVKNQKFDKAGVFSFSKEEGTRAAKMSDEVPDEVKEERYHKLMSVQGKISETVNESIEGKIFDVLVEGINTSENVAVGRSYREAPEVDGNVYIENAGNLSEGEIVKVRVLQGFAYDVVGELLKEDV